MKELVLIVIKKNTGGEGLTCKDSTTNREKKMNNIHSRLVEDKN
jgi:hypothetical protein